MFDSNKSRDCIRAIKGWKDHYDTDDIPALSAELKESESGEYYQEEHPALRLDYIKASLPSNRSLEEYLKEVEDSAITAVLNDIQEKKELEEVSKELVGNDVILNSYGWINDTILNEGRFVGIMLRPRFDIGIKAIVNRMGLQFTQPQTGLKIYLYHSQRREHLAVYEFTSTKAGDFVWQDVNEFIMTADDKELSGGTYYLGYYQDDIMGNAVQYRKLNWDTGFCRSCDQGVRQKAYGSISKHIQMGAFYVPSANLDAGRLMFDPEAVMTVSENNWGMNLNISVNCDLTNFICDNRNILKKALGLKVAEKIMKGMLFSTEINSIEEQLRFAMIRELEGDKETRHTPLPKRYEKAIEALHLNTSSINSTCLPCQRKSGVSYGSH